VEYSGGEFVWIDLAHDRESLRAVLNVVINIRFHKMRRISE
jgi:hypothetical protein